MNQQESKAWIAKVKEAARAFRAADTEAHEAIHARVKHSVTAHVVSSADMAAYETERQRLKDISDTANAVREGALLVLLHTIEPIT